MNPNTRQLLELAIERQQAGQGAEAESLYQQILRDDPTNADALHMLGVFECERDHFDRAVELIRLALEQDEKWPEAHNNLGNALMGKHSLDDAIEHFRRAIQLMPEYAHAWNNLGNALHAKGLFPEAVAVGQNAVSIQPLFPQAWCNLGNARRSLGDVSGALAAFQRAITQDPNFIDALLLLGETLRSVGKVNQAIQVFERVVKLKPKWIQGYNLLGNALLHAGRDDDAMATYRYAIGLAPDEAITHSNLCGVLKQREMLDEAIVEGERSLQIEPNQPICLNNIGGALLEVGRITDSIAAYRKATELEPHGSMARSNLILAMLADPLTADAAIIKSLADYRIHIADPFRPTIRLHPNDRDPDRRLRIGYMSSDFRDHASAFFLVPLLANHDHEAVEVFCYNHFPWSDSRTAQMKADGQWRQIATLSDEQAADLIRQDRIDVLIDCKLHSGGNRLEIFARKPAPVQASWLGYPGSTGLDVIDYRITDRFLDSPDEPDRGYVERPIRLSDCFWCYDPLAGRDVPVGPLPSITKGFITFGSLNKSHKINEAVIDLWATGMRRLDRSRLKLLIASTEQRQRIVRQFQTLGISEDRIEFLYRLPRIDYLKAYHDIDIGLDTAPYNGHTTTFDSLWMGVPVITIAGERPVARGGVSILSNLGMPELVAKDADDFVRIVKELADDPARLLAIRSSLRTRMEQSPLTDGKRFARSMEAAYRQMWMAAVTPNNI